jgi:hypothetical protein
MSRAVGVDSVREAAGRYLVTVWREIETVEVVKRGGSWVIQGTDSLTMAGKSWPDKSGAITALTRHYRERG